MDQRRTGNVPVVYGARYVVFTPRSCPFDAGETAFNSLGGCGHGEVPGKLAGVGSSKGEISPSPGKDVQQPPSQSKGESDKINSAGSLEMHCPNAPMEGVPARCSRCLHGASRVACTRRAARTTASSSALRAGRRGEEAGQNALERDDGASDDAHAARAACPIAGSATMAQVPRKWNGADSCRVPSRRLRLEGEGLVLDELGRVDWAGEVDAGREDDPGWWGYPRGGAGGGRTSALAPPQRVIGAWKVTFDAPDSLSTDTFPVDRLVTSLAWPCFGTYGTRHGCVACKFGAVEGIYDNPPSSWMKSRRERRTLGPGRSFSCGVTAFAFPSRINAFTFACDSVIFAFSPAIPWPRCFAVKEGHIWDLPGFGYIYHYAFFFGRASPSRRPHHQAVI
ncbi:hypothetical protein C8R44DRAFT_724997 [Mycena epipterygia]|nr:hypothetical protein C8R44DRAFT_724997 [Mycena epipterygia]